MKESLRILVVEDEAIIMESLRAILSSFGECLTADNGDGALSIFKRALTEDNLPFDLVCMDIMMPGMDGMEAVKRIRAFEKQQGISPAKEVKVIMVTALSDPKTVMSSMYDSGADAYIVKPIDENQLFAEMKKLELI